MASIPYDGMTPDDYGELLWKSKGCVSCHSIDGKAGTGPTWKGAWGEEHKMKDGAVVKVDLNYIEESILYPQAKVVAGYQGVMPSYNGQLTQLDIQSISEFIKRLSVDDYKPLPPLDRESTSVNESSEGETELAKGDVAGEDAPKEQSADSGGTDAAKTEESD